MTNMDHMRCLEDVTSEDVAELERKEGTYKGSWKRRGGVGAFMMMARKWDRLESMLEHQITHRYDVFWSIEDNASGDDGTVLAEIRDLRRYLILVEAEMMARGVVASCEAVVPLMRTTAATASQLARAAGAVNETEDREQPRPPASAVPGPSTDAGISTRTINPHFEQVVADGKIHEQGKPSRPAEGRGKDGVTIRVGDACTCLLPGLGGVIDTRLIDIRADGMPAVEYGKAPGGLTVPWSALRKQPVETDETRTVPRLREQGEYRRAPDLDTPSCGDGTFDAHQRRPGFDIGNGHVVAGDFAGYRLNGVAELCVKVLDVLQDGDAVIDTGSGTKTVKWNQLRPLESKNTAPTKDQQRTPEDGAQHASLAPWVVGPDYFDGRVTVAMREIFWHRRAPGTHVLEPRVISVGLPRALHGLYEPDFEKNEWLIRMDKVPADARDMFPRLRRERNAVEHAELPEWQQKMYVWSGDGRKFLLLDKYAAWTGDES